MTLLIAIAVASSSALAPTPRAVALAPTPRTVTPHHNALVTGVSSATLRARAMVYCVAPALSRDNEDNEVLTQLRHQQAQLRRLRRLAREKAIESSSAVSSALHAEAKSYERARTFTLHRTRNSLRKYMLLLMVLRSKEILCSMSLYAVAQLDDIQRELVRATRAGLIRERRLAERKWRAWRRSGRDDF